MPPSEPGGAGGRVLRVAKVGVGGHGYYLAPTVRAGAGIEPDGRWHGRAAAALGLEGTIEPDTLGVVLSGVEPSSGELLGREEGKVRVAAYDLTFCAPKSVSLLHGLADGDVSRKVGQAHQAAVEATVGYIERRAAAVRRPDGGPRVPTAPDGVLVAAFDHRTSRALDPHLHTHALVANLGHGAGRWSALDGRGLYAHRAAADALYHAHLRHELRSRLGLRFDPPLRGRADLAGIGPEVREVFSRRSVAIAAELGRGGWAGGAAAERAALVTRPAKDLQLSADDLRPAWRERAAAAGLGPRHLDQVLEGRARHVGGARSGDRDLQVPSPWLGERPWARRDAVRAEAAASIEGAAVAEVEARVDRILGRSGVDPRMGQGVAEARLAPAADGMLVRLLAERGMARPGPRLDRGPELVR